MTLGEGAGDSTGTLAGLRPTRRRVAVLGAVEHLGVFSGARAVYEELNRGSGHVALSTVYRTLQSLAERGMIDSVRGPDGETRYRKCADEPHHHLVCRRCGQTVELPGGAVSRAIQQRAHEAGYADVEHILDVFGTCPDCLSAPD